MGAFKEIFVWLFIFVIGSLIVSFLISSESFDSFKQNVGDITGNVINNIKDLKIDSISEKSSGKEKQDIQINECLAKFEECKRISEAKNSASIKINEYEKFTEYNEAVEFYRTWSSSDVVFMLNSGIEQGYIPNENMPLVLIATSTEWDFGYERIKMPFVAVCDSNYNLVGQTKTLFNC